MPPFREGPVTVDRRLDGDMLKELRDAGHGRRISIVDASYDIPEGRRVLKFPGSSAEALLAIVSLIPIETDSLKVMRPDTSDKEHAVNWFESPEGEAFRRFRQVFGQLKEAGIFSDDVRMQPKTRYDEPSLVDENKYFPGFYKIANDPDQSSVFIRTIDELPFACITLLAGHSQRLAEET